MTRQNVLELVTEAIAALDPFVRTVSPAHQLERDLDIDSIERVELVSDVAVRCGLSSRDIDAEGVSTVADLVDRILAALRPAGQGA